jgi:hypothetical protein
MRLALVVTFLAVVCLQSPAQEFWNGARYGMTKGQLQARFGDQLEPSETKPAEGYSAYTAYRMETHICAAKFIAYFIFQARKPRDKLVAIMLSTKDDGPSKTLIATCVVEEFSAVYGRPVVKEETRSSGRYVFTRADTRVDIGTAPSIGMVTIKYGLKPKL